MFSLLSSFRSLLQSKKREGCPASTGTTEPDLSVLAGGLGYNADDNDTGVNLEWVGAELETWVDFKEPPVCFNICNVSRALGGDELRGTGGCRVVDISEGILKEIFLAQNFVKWTLMEYQAHSGQRVRCLCKEVRIDLVERYNDEFSVVNIEFCRNKTRCLTSALFLEG
jgi:hypothetical protein